ncbi:MAG: NADH-quinone oxidoreductase subunit A [Desulfurococcales archaeon]|nr:NADH-quinone oxidoreductase subunit A [Desulfurococcales archaeon]
MPLDWSDPFVRSTLSLVIIPLLLVLMLLMAIMFLRIVTATSRDVASLEKYKELRYEAGNPMKGEAKSKVSMQYFGFLVIFLAVEPAIILLAIALTVPQALTGKLLYLYGVFIAVYTPLLLYAVKEARRIEAWMID